VALSLTPWARAEYDFARKALGRPRGASKKARIERARRFAVCMWMAIGQRRSKVDGAGTCGWRNRLMADQSPVPTWQRLPDRVRVASARLLEAQIEARPALDVIRRHADKDVLIYADPPYHHDTRQKQIYAHEMDDAAHSDLLIALQGHPGPVLLSSYHCALYDSCLSHWKSFETQARAQTNAIRTEVLWLNPVAWGRLQGEQSQREMQPVLQFPAYELRDQEGEAA
jgi:DNA adenine methylase